MNHVGIKGFPINSTSYLANKFQCVKIEGDSLTIKLLKRGVLQRSVLGPLSFLVYIIDLGVHEDWQSEIIKNTDDTVMIEKLNTQSEDKNLFRSWANMNDLDCKYTKTKFVVFEKRSMNYPNLLFGNLQFSLGRNTDT